MEEIELEKAIETIENYLELFSNLGKNLKYNKDKVDYYHNVELDFNHKLELEDLGYHEIGKMTRDYKKSRVERRVFKDKVEWQGDLFDLYSNNAHLSQSVHLLRNHLGRLRKVRDNQSNRIYIKKVQEI